MLLTKLIQAKKNLGLEEKLIISPKNDEGFVEKEEVIIGQDYYDDNSDYTGERPDLGEGILKKDDNSPNDLDSDADIDFHEENTEKEIEEEVKSTMTELSEYAAALSPTIEELEESMDRLQEMENKKEDTSGKTKSFVFDFLENYAEGNDIIQVLRKDLMSLISDIQWIKESNNQNEQWAIDFVDAVNELSVSI